MRSVLGRELVISFFFSTKWLHIQRIESISQDLTVPGWQRVFPHFCVCVCFFLHLESARNVHQSNRIAIVVVAVVVVVRVD